MDAFDSLTAVIAVLPQEPGIESTLFITRDGGNYWDSLTFPSYHWVTDVSILDENHIWVCTSDPCEILATTDGGNSWITQFVAFDTITSFFNYIEMFDLNNGIVMGDAPYPAIGKPAAILKTSDGGENWNLINNKFSNAYSYNTWRNIDFINTENGFFKPSYDSSNRHAIYKTDDGGINWIELNYINGAVSGLKFYNEQYGLAYINSCYPYHGTFVIRTSDSGQTWDSVCIHNAPYAVCDDFEFLKSDPSKVWLVILDTLYFSPDSGKSWQKDPLSSEFTRGRDLVCVDGKVCWLLCESVYRNLNADKITSINQVSGPVEGFYLLQNYPNPFNSSTVVRYQLSVVSKITLKIFDILGREVEFLVDEEKPAGTYEVTWNAANQPSGVYFYQLKALPSNRQTAGFFQIKKMILLK